MKKTLVVSNETGTVNIALLEDGRLQELHEEENNQNFSVGDVFIGKVKKMAPSLNSCFVNIGHTKDAFLHYHDLGPHIKSLLDYTDGVSSGRLKSPKISSFSLKSEIDKDGLIENALIPNQKILVQITKEPISTKGPRISSEISLAGRFLVLVPFGDKVSISRNISSIKEKDRLRKLGESVRPKGFGLIIRTVAEGKKEEELEADLKYLLNKWNYTCFKNLKKNKVPNKILGEMGKVSSILRDNLNSDFEAIVCDDSSFTEEIKEYLSIIAPEKQDIVKHYDLPTPLFEYYNIEKQIKQLLGKHVNIPQSKGAYLVIEHTEALHVIDVNSGNVTANKKNQEENALHINKLAATEIARQLKLRDMGGIIVIDFIDLNSAENKKELYDHLRDVMNTDKAKHKILPASKFGLIQITRERVRPQKQIATTEKNPNNVEAPINIIDVLEAKIQTLASTSTGKLTIHTHPFIAAYITKGLYSIQNKWRWKYKRNISIIERNSFNYLEYKILDNEGKTLYKYSN